MAIGVREQMKEWRPEKTESKPASLNRKSWGLFLLIVTLGLFLRLYHISSMEFKGDEAFNSFKAITLAREGVIPLTSGVSSTGINEPPLFMYFLAVPFLLTSNPLVAAAYIALWNVLGIALCFLFTRINFGVRAGFIAAALYAVNPWQVLFSRKIWTQSLLAPFALLFLLLLCLSLLHKKPRFLSLAGLALGILLQLHMSAAFALPVAVFLVWISRREVKAAHLAAAVLLMVLTFVPYLIFQAQHHFGDVRTALSINQGKGSFHGDAVPMLLRMMTTQGFEYSLGASFQEFAERAVRLRLIDIVSASLLAFGFAVGILRRKREYLWVMSWLIGGLIYLSLLKTPLFIHYFLALLPISFVLIGAALAWLPAQLKGNYASWALSSLVGLVVVYQLVFCLDFNDFSSRTPCIHGDYGPPFTSRVQKIAEAIDRQGFPAAASQLQQIHAASAYCEKCDPLATEFIVKYVLPFSSPQR